MHYYYHYISPKYGFAWDRPCCLASQAGQPKHSAKKAVKAIEIAMLWCVLYSIQRNESQQAYLLENTSTLICPSLRCI